MITKDKIDSFIAFQQAGGLSKAENLTKGVALLSLSGTLSASYAATVEQEADYTADGVQRLPEAIQALSSELCYAASVLPGWNGFISLASEPTDLEQVSQGAKVYRIVEGVPNDTLWPSVLPITSKAELLALEVAINAVKTHINAVQALMTEINASVWPDEIVVVGPDGCETSERNPVPLTSQQKQACLSLADTLELEVGKVQAAAAVIDGMVKDATSSRATALDWFQKAVTFTIASNQVDRADIGPATREVFKHS
ncbi:hypothetical protein [Vibrio alginolyticus]|uniref:hypothetical protein n=1 Tax=Vibrio alginolyticus TaxID=663 RepID=UPI001BD4FC5E|nr:hypothetical protein [Vibrio alginolyticus]MBT0119380.1 hypothetical protein [Vibrio alginolyticus]